jgi:hypothetical protein
VRVGGTRSPRRRVFDEEYMHGLDRWRGEVDEWRRAHDEEHDQAEEAEQRQQAVVPRQRRGWPWDRIVQWAAVAATLAAAWISATAGR